MAESPATLEGYYDLLVEYDRTGGEQALYKASLMSEAFIEGGLGPEDITAFHLEAVSRLLESQPDVMRRTHILGRAHQFLLEVMINYGVKYKEYIDLRLQDSLRKAEDDLDRERRKVEEAARLEQEKLELLGSIAHEMATPLTAARGNVAIANRLLAGRVLEVQPILDSTKTALGRLSRLTADLMHLSRGQMPELTLTEVDLCGILRDACSWAKVAADEKGIVLTVDIGVDEVWIDGHSDSLLTLFGNLLANAIRYTPARGSIRVSCAVSGEDVQVLVQDTGIGIPEDVQGHIFERFYRADDARRFSPAGLGLGLAMCSQIVTAHGGSIDVDSTPGEGSTFTVHLTRHHRDVR